jgi:GT2 family glycosyltransferase
VTIGVVTHESEGLVAECLRAVAAQTYERLETVVIDNASRDGSADAAQRAGRAARVVRNAANVGYAAAHNQALRLAAGELYLALNPDVVMRPDFVAELVEAAAAHPEAGSVGGKLLRPSAPGGPALLDSTGMYMTPWVRHLDRGAGQPDRGQYDRVQYVFGITGAAALYRRRMLEDVAVGGEAFDESFFCYREDADLAWRAQLLGWHALYTPRAVATHARRVTPERRASLPPEINLHSVKNRYLLRLKNHTALDFLVLLLPSLVREAQVVSYTLLFERTSLPAFGLVARNLRSAWRKRRAIMGRRRVGGARMLRWFRARPAAFDVPGGRG